MVTIAHLVKKAVQENQFLLEAMSRDLVSFGNLASTLKADIEKELGKTVKDSAIVMALRRYADELGRFSQKTESQKLHGELIMRTNVMDLNVVKSPSFSARIKDLYNVVDVEHGDIFNIILGNNEASIITNEKYKDKLDKFLKGEKIISRQFELVAVTIRFTGKDFLTTPGVIFSAVRRLAWEHINVYEIVSTMTELTFIVHKKDSNRAYNLLQELVE
jgi:aspartokinase